MSIQGLPAELFLHLCSYLNREEQHQLSRTCQSLFATITKMHIYNHSIEVGSTSYDLAKYIKRYCLFFITNGHVSCVHPKNGENIFATWLQVDTVLAQTKAADAIVWKTLAEMGTLNSKMQSQTELAKWGMHSVAPHDIKYVKSWMLTVAEEKGYSSAILQLLKNKSA